MDNKDHLNIVLSEFFQKCRALTPACNSFHANFGCVSFLGRESFLVSINVDDDACLVNGL